MTPGQANGNGPWRDPTPDKVEDNKEDIEDNSESLEVIKAQVKEMFRCVDKGSFLNHNYCSEWCNGDKAFDGPQPERAAQIIRYYSHPHWDCGVNENKQDGDLDYGYKCDCSGCNGCE